MVSFCDLPLSQVRTHLRIYGNYGIGLRKDWGKANGVSPVLYSYRESSFLDHLRKVIHENLDEGSRNEPLNPKFYRRVFGILSFLKQYEGDFKRRDQDYPNLRFYNEREWRYVPDTIPEDLQQRQRPEYKDLSECLISEEFNDPITLQENNRSIAQDFFRIKFQPKDIKYIIVADENEIGTMIHSIHDIKDKYSKDDLDLLTSRIISSQQIKDDF